MTDEPLVGDAGHEARARAQDFTIDAYHGSRTPLRGEGFDPALIGSHTGAHVAGFHFASDPRWRDGRVTGERAPPRIRVASFAAERGLR